jgi:hypothetical protein
MALMGSNEDEEEEVTDTSRLALKICANFTSG